MYESLDLSKIESCITTAQQLVTDLHDIDKVNKDTSRSLIMDANSILESLKILKFNKELQDEDKMREQNEVLNKLVAEQVTQTTGTGGN